mgnify:CR=1 FL=1
MASPLQCSEAGNILEFTIFSNKTGRSADVGPGVVTLQYFESILDSSVRFIAVIVDSGNSDKGGEAINVLQDLKLEGSEKCHITIADNQNNKLKFADDNAMYIKEIRNIISSSESTVYTLELMNKEMIANDLLSTEVYRRFDGEISQSAEIILKEILKTTKTVILDATSNTFNFIGQGKKPFRLLSEIATKGVSQASKQSAGYLIFETYDGYNFRSIDNLFEDEEGHKSYVFNDSVKLPSGYDGKILRYDADSTIDVEKNLSTGTYGSRMETVNTYTQIFNTKAQEIDTEEQKVHGGLEIPTLSKEFQEQFVTDGAVSFPDISSTQPNTILCAALFIGGLIIQLRNSEERKKLSKVRKIVNKMHNDDKKAIQKMENLTWENRTEDYKKWLVMGASSVETMRRPEFRNRVNIPNPPPLKQKS